MKINEIILEGHITKTAFHAIPGMNMYPDLDSSDPYKAYRYGVAMAGAPNIHGDPVGPTGTKLLTVGYSKADDEIISQASKAMGVKSVPVTSEGSTEPHMINTTSPVVSRGPITKKK